MVKPAKALFKGHAPTVTIGAPDLKKIIGNPERFKYEAAWKHDDYRKYSPGEACLPIFMDTVKPARGSTFVDWGCGTGRAGHTAWKQGLDVTLVDFIEHSLDESVRDDLCGSLQFVQHDITKPMDARTDYGYCAILLAHPSNRVEQHVQRLVCIYCIQEVLR